MKYQVVLINSENRHIPYQVVDSQEEAAAMVKALRQRAGSYYYPTES
jgi:hypothetical protein